MKNLDWNKAPDGATHFNKELGCPWLKETPPSYFYNGDWIEYGSNFYEGHFSNAIKRPQEWDGSSVPPAGTECEYSLNECGKWHKCKIIYVLTEPDHSFVAWCDNLDMDQVFSFKSDDYTLQLRKIKTPEQIAEEKRLQAIDEMLGYVERYSTFKSVIEAIYDAGYRKT